MNFFNKIVIIIITVPLQPATKDGRTPLMSAALDASDDTVFSLLSWGADPDRTDADGDPALIFAIQSKCLTTINLLAPKTKANLGRALVRLAKNKVDLVTGELRQLVERAAQDRENLLIPYTTLLKKLLPKAHFQTFNDKEPVEFCPSDCSQKQSCQRIRETLRLVQLVERAAQDRKAAIIGILAAAKFGSSKMIEIIAKSTNDYSIFETNKQKLWMEAMMSDSGPTVSALLQILPKPTFTAVYLAKKRGVPGVVRLLLPDTKVDGEEEREALRNAVLTNTQTSIKVESAWEPPLKCLGKRVFCNNHVVATKQRKLQ